MRVAAIWRYPVKSMAGERVNRAQLTAAGVEGDRVVQVYDRHGRIATARTFPRLLGLRATLAADGEPLVNGVSWRAPEAAAWVEGAVGPGAYLQRDDSLDRFDILPLLVCTDGAVSSFGRDVRRLRPNILIQGVASTPAGNSERGWTGAALQLPHATIRLADLRGRCVMTTYDPDTLEHDPAVLRDIVRRFGGRLCLNASVVRPGVIEAGDAVHLADTAVTQDTNTARG